MRPNHFYIHLKKISPFVLKALDYCSTIHSPENAVYIVRKKPNLNSRVIEDLRKALRERDDLKETEVIKKVLSEPSLHSECWTVEDKGEQQQPSPMKLPPQKLTLFNDGNLDASKRAALAKCAECEPVTILFGPPGMKSTRYQCARPTYSAIGILFHCLCFLYFFFKALERPPPLPPPSYPLSPMVTAFWSLPRPMPRVMPSLVPF